jgi:fucose permease
VSTAAPTSTSPVDPSVRRAVLSTYLVFATSGFAFANWASRIPQVKTHLGLTNGQMGTLLLAIAAGSVVALPSAGKVISRLGSRRTVFVMAVLMAVGFAIAAFGYLVGVPLMAAGLFVFGFANGAWDVAMNVQGALVERELGRAIMPRFHAGWSLGTVTGALLGALMVLVEVPVTAHLLAVAVVIVVLVPIGVRGYLPDHEDVEADGSAAPTRSALAAWREPRTLLIGLFVLSFAFAEGAGNDWISIAIHEDYGSAAALGTLGFAIFLASMTAGRWFGPLLLDRYGRVTMVRATAVVAVVGVLLFVFGGSTPVAYGGAVLWGLGVSLGFPVGMSAGADDPRYAASRVSVIASIGYCAFLGGPPLLGFLGDHFTVLKAFIAVAVLLGVSALIAAAVRPPAEVPAAEPARPV